MDLLDYLLGKAFPPDLKKLVIPKEQVCWKGGPEPEDLRDGILWRAYDVRMEGIEKVRAGVHEHPSVD